MPVQTQSFNTIVANAVAAVQGAAAQLIDFTIGSVLRAVVEAVSAIALWLQGIALQVAALTRFATSNGIDADSWAADFRFHRLARQQPSSGQVTLGRYTPTFQALIPVGTTVQTSDGTEIFAVIADITQTAYNAGLNAYVIPATTTTCTATVQATTPGTASNVAAGLINTLSPPIANVDYVTNASAFTNGAAAETDAAFRARVRAVHPKPARRRRCSPSSQRFWAFSRTSTSRSRSTITTPEPIRPATSTSSLTTGAARRRARSYRP